MSIGTGGNIQKCRPLFFLYLSCRNAVSKPDKRFCPYVSFVPASGPYWFGVPADVLHELFAVPLRVSVKLFAKIYCHFQIDLIGVYVFFLLLYNDFTGNAVTEIVHYHRAVNFLHDAIIFLTVKIY